MISNSKQFENLRKAVKFPIKNFGGGFQDATGRHLGSINEDVFTSADGDNWMELLMALAEFIPAAMNEKAQRDDDKLEDCDIINPHVHCPKCQYPIYKSDFNFGEDGEPLRWEKCRSRISPFHNIRCPKCKSVKMHITPCCPECGQKLDPPAKR